MRQATWCVAALAAFGATAGPVREAEAAPFVNRPMTLSRSDWALDFGLGIGHRDEPTDDTGFGLNLEIAAGLTSFLQLGVRTGIRFGSDGRVTGADYYGRTHETETYNTGGDTLANPEISLKYAIVDTSIAHLGIDARLYLPTDGDSKVGVMFGVPVGIHLGGVALLNTGIYIPIVFTDPVQNVISFPFHLWFQANDRVFLGPLTGVRIVNPGGNAQVPLGFAFGYSISYDADIKTWLLFPNVSDDGANRFGVGVGLQIRF